jgi:hypothetical protein
MLCWLLSITSFPQLPLSFCNCGSYMVLFSIIYRYSTILTKYTNNKMDLLLWRKKHLDEVCMTLVYLVSVY